MLTPMISPLLAASDSEQKYRGHGLQSLHTELYLLHGMVTLRCFDRRSLRSSSQPAGISPVSGTIVALSPVRYLASCLHPLESGH